MLDENVVIFSHQYLDSTDYANLGNQESHSVVVGNVRLLIIDIEQKIMQSKSR